MTDTVFLAGPKARVWREWAMGMLTAIENKIDGAAPEILALKKRLMDPDIRLRYWKRQWPGRPSRKAKSLRSGREEG